MSDLLQSRVVRLNKTSHSGDAVVYVMSRDQRVRDNHALYLAQQDALARKVPLLVLFNLYIGTNVRSREHYSFMLDGLEAVAADLAKHQIGWVMRSGDSLEQTLQVLAETCAASVYFDFSPLRHARTLAKAVASSFQGEAYVVDTHNVIPTWIASDKQEFAAHTMRNKVHKLLAAYLSEPPQIEKHAFATDQIPAGIDVREARHLVEQIPACGVVLDYAAGEAAAHERLTTFLQSELKGYALKRNDIANDNQSRLSPYLHFGQISSLRVALETVAAAGAEPLLYREARLASGSDEPSSEDGMNALLEEMIVRKELADNFCFYNTDYKSLAGAHEWALKTLDEHRADSRDFTYSCDQWELAQTHDQSWNAAQQQLRKSGKIHGYMRMYWAKKFLEWSASPEEALEVAIYLNDKYSIDGGDPNGYVGILWSIAGLHDRPWTERAVFGKIRFMNEGGLMRKYDVKAYWAQWL